jgi:hypothetical protein
MERLRAQDVEQKRNHALETRSLCLEEQNLKSQLQMVLIWELSSVFLCVLLYYVCIMREIMQQKTNRLPTVCSRQTCFRRTSTSKYEKLR